MSDMPVTLHAVVTRIDRSASGCVVHLARDPRHHPDAAAHAAMAVELTCEVLAALKNAMDYAQFYVSAREK